MKVDSNVFVLAVALIAAVALICGLVTGFLSWRGGATPPNAALRGFTAFGGALTIGILFYSLVVESTIPVPPYAYTVPR